MVDDMVDDVQSFVVAAVVLNERGAYKIYVLATHVLLSSDAPQLIENSPIDEVVVTNTVPHEVQKMQCHKIKTVDISVPVRGHPAHPPQGVHVLPLPKRHARGLSTPGSLVFRW
ncbi:phosphoribosyl pyrophosphate synthase-associated protein 1-like [Dermacentor silvarum]|uniref:phosphoribosyl pyrophosphate synthase-associated protein 1-like n=1 Tax=Dermacentor silvarum TaxID=543639 RepID=UPI00189BCA14|nr:phosphoribosyl pyrophosphate synthase-associated protein 1-like [Dermacentor silvarum]